MFCPKCGSKISNEAEFCPNCGENLEKAKNLLEETPVISESDIELSLEGDVEVLYVLPNTVNKFYLKVKNNSSNPIRDVKVKLSGPSHVDLLTNLIIFQVIGAKSTNSAPIKILPKESVLFTLSAKLQSSNGHSLSFLIEIGHSLTFPIELRTEVSKSIERIEIPVRSIQKNFTHISRTAAGVDQTVVFLVISALIGVILMISGVGVFFTGDFSSGLSTGITLLVIGFICLSIGTKGKLCTCACDGC